MTSLLCFDPGQTTGWARFEYGATEPAICVDHGQITGGLHGFIAWTNRYRPFEIIDEIVGESFVNDHRTVNPDVMPLRLEGAIEALWGNAGIPIVWQRNSQKNHANDLVLKRGGLYFRGEQHARDAARHGLAFLKVRRHRPTILRYWPREEAS